MRYVTQAANEGITAKPRTGVRRAFVSPRRGPRIGRWVALALVAASFAIPASAAAYQDPGGFTLTSQSLPANQFPIAAQQDLSANAPVSDRNGDTLAILLSSSALLVAVGSAGVAATTRARTRRSPQPGA
jgi:hypothetical protein